MIGFSGSRLAIVCAGLVGSGFFCSQIQAAPVQGEIDFGGVVTFDTNSLDTATRVSTWNSSFVTDAQGDFDTFANAGDPAVMATPWIFNPSTNTPALWKVGGFTFDLTSSVIVSQTSTFLNITGAGTITGNGFDPTPGTWSFTSSGNGAPDVTFGFQANSSPVPEGGTIALFAFGTAILSGGQFLRRRFKTA